MGNIHTCLGKRRASVGIECEEEAGPYRKVEEGVKIEFKENNPDITTEQQLYRDEWIRSIQETNIRIAFFDAIYEDLVHAAFVGWDELRLRALWYKKSLGIFTIPKERFWNVHSSEADSTAAEIYPDDASSRLKPAKCLGDGNCLYRAISTLLFGSEEHHLEIRLRVTLELIHNWEDYLYGDTLQKMSTHKVDGLVESVVQTSVLDYGADAAESMKEEIFRTLILGSYSSIVHLYAAANATHRDVVSIYPDVRNIAIDRDLLHQTIKPLQPDHGEPLYIMWTNTANTHLDASWTPNHFVPCIYFDMEPERGAQSCSSTQLWSDNSTDKKSNSLKKLSEEMDTKDKQDECPQKTSVLLDQPGKDEEQQTKGSKKAVRDRFFFNKIKFKFPWTKKKTSPVDSPR